MKNPKYVKDWNAGIIAIFIFFSFLLSPRLCLAGDVWVYPEKFAELSRGDILSIQVGRGQVFPKIDERVVTKKLKIRVYSTGDREYLLPLEKEKQFWSSEFTVKKGGAHLIVADIAEDFWTKTGEKWVNLPKHKVPAHKQSIAFWYLSKVVTSAKPDNSLYRKHLGYPLEIIPLDNPAKIKAGEILRLKVLFQGQPGSSIPLETAYAGFSKNPEIKVESIRTDQNGIAEITIEQNGLWYVTARKYIRASNNVQYDSASYQSNLIFLIQPEKPVE